MTPVALPGAPFQLSESAGEVAEPKLEHIEVEARRVEHVRITRTVRAVTKQAWSKQGQPRMQLASTTWFARTHPDTLPAHARPQNPQMSYLHPTELGKWADITLAMNMLASEDAVRGCHVRRGGTSKDTLPCFGIFIADRVFMHGIRSWP